MSFNLPVNLKVSFRGGKCTQLNCMVNLFRVLKE